MALIKLGLGCPMTFAQKTAPNLRLSESSIEKDRPGTKHDRSGEPTPIGSASRTAKRQRNRVRAKGDFV